MFQKQFSIWQRDSLRSLGHAHEGLTQIVKVHFVSTILVEM